MVERISQAAARAVPLALILAGCAGAEPTSKQSDPVVEGEPANTVGGFSAQIPAEQLEPGDETTPCWVLPLEVEGPSRFVAAASLTTGVGLHHGNITTRPKTGEGVRPCEERTGLGGSEAVDVLDGGAVLFGSSTQVVGTEWRNFPRGMAFRIKQGFEIVARMHYLNSTSEPISVSPEYRWYTVPEEDVENELAPIFWDITGFEIPPNSQHTVSTECYFYEPMKVVSAMPHMHALGTRFTMGYLGGPKDGELFMDDVGFDPESDIYTYSPAIDLSQGDGATFSCTWDNIFDKTIVEGIGDNEMCMMFGYAYPAKNAFSAISTDNGRCAVVLPPDPNAG